MRSGPPSRCHRAPAAQPRSCGVSRGRAAFSFSGRWCGRRPRAGVTAPRPQPRPGVRLFFYSIMEHKVGRSLLNWRGAPRGSTMVGGSAPRIKMGSWRAAPSGYSPAARGSSVARYHAPNHKSLLEWKGCLRFAPYCANRRGPLINQPVVDGKIKTKLRPRSAYAFLISARW